MGVQVTAAKYAGFLEAIGHRVVSTPSAYWYDASRIVCDNPDYSLDGLSGTARRKVRRGLLRFAEEGGL